MKPTADAGSETERVEGWDDTVLVWNATVARIPAPVPAASAADGGGPNVTSDRGEEPRS